MRGQLTMTDPHPQTPDNEPESRSESGPSLAALQRHAVNGHMGTLAVRLLDDIVRIVEAEVKLVEVNFGSALTASLDRAVGRFLAALLLFLGACCLLAGLIMLLANFLAMWEALAIAGVAASAAGLAVAWIAGLIAKGAERKLTKG